MTAQKGKDILLKVHDGTAFVTVAGLRTKQMSFQAESIDITNADSQGRWRELLNDAGLRRASISAAGLFKDATSDTLLRSLFFEGTTPLCQLVLPALGTLEGLFFISALEYRGEHTAEVTFDITLESAGVLSFTAAP